MSLMRYMLCHVFLSVYLLLFSLLDVVNSVPLVMKFITLFTVSALSQMTSIMLLYNFKTHRNGNFIVFIFFALLIVGTGCLSYNLYQFKEYIPMIIFYGITLCILITNVANPSKSLQKIVGVWSIWCPLLLFQMFLRTC